MTASIFLLLAVIIWGWNFVASKIVLEYISPLNLMGFRLIIGLPIMYSIIRARGLKFDFRGHRKGLVLGSVFITIHFAIQFTGLKYTSATNTGWLIGAVPLVTAVLAYFILKERINRNAVIGIIVATIGIVLLISKGKLNDMNWLSSIGDWLVLGSCFTWGFYTIYTRDLSRACDPLTTTFTVLLTPALIGIVFIIFTFNWSIVKDLTMEVIIALLCLGIFGTALAHWFWQEGVARLGATRAGIYLYLEPLATTALAVPYLNESFGIYTAIGGTLVLLGVWKAQRKESRKIL